MVILNKAHHWNLSLDQSTLRTNYSTHRTNDFPDQYHTAGVTLNYSSSERNWVCWTQTSAFKHSQTLGFSILGWYYSVTANKTVSTDLNKQQTLFLQFFQLCDKPLFRLLNHSVASVDPAHLCIHSSLNTPPSCACEMPGGSTQGMWGPSRRESDIRRAIPRGGKRKHLESPAWRLTMPELRTSKLDSLDLATI